MKPRHYERGAKFTCPMHPEVEQDRPGVCPKCGINLERTQDRRIPESRPKANEEEGGENGASEKAASDSVEMTRQMREKWLWTNGTVMVLGLWLVFSPATFNYTSAAMTWSDVVSGGLLVVLAGLALFPRWDFVGRWTVAVVGVWLQFAPLVFWAPEPVAYVNNTLIGALAIALSILIPMMPGMAHHMAMTKSGPEIPPGWSYNPSTWHQRMPMIVLALFGWFISRYLAAAQLGYIPQAWEPFFGEGTERVLHSEISRMWPVPDAGLGALVYTLEFLMAWMGGKTRWRTMPWMVFFFFILVVPLGLAHITLVILQPVAVGYWCTLCLLAAFLMLLMIPYTVDEVVATGQFVRKSVKDGKPFWRVFFIGDTVEGGGPDERTPAYGAPVSGMIAPMHWGVTASWNLALGAFLGLWIMLTPAIFGMEGAAQNSNFIAGALIITFSIISMAEVIRAGRYLNVVLAAWIILSPFLLAGAGQGGTWSNLVAGAIVMLISLRRGKVRETYGGWDRYIF
jgi:hypothetical protein